MKNKKYYLKLIKIKADLLCYGIRQNKYSKEFYKIQNPYNIQKGGLIGLHFVLDDTLQILASTTYEFDKKSQFEIIKEKKEFYLKSKKEKIKISPIIMPKWYNKKTSTGKQMSKIFAHESNNFLHQQYSGCIYQSTGFGCKFCGTGKNFIYNTPKEIAETVITAYKENKNYQVCLGGGTRSTTEKNSEYFIECIKLIRKENKKIPIWIEMTPPTTDITIKNLIKVGATAFGLNLEIWDDKLRKNICPGKSKISKKRYFEAWKYIKNTVGKDKVNTALIAGLEPKTSILKGIHKISQQGIRITLLPFKPWDTSEFKYKKPKTPKELYSLSMSLAKDMIKYNIPEKQNYGCASCTSCTLEEDIKKYLF